MAYGDATLDEIMAQLRASEGAPRPQFRITQASSVLPNVAQAPATPAAVPLGPETKLAELRRLGGQARGSFRTIARGAGRLALPLQVGLGLNEAADITGAVSRGEMAATPENRFARGVRILSGGLFSPSGSGPAPAAPVVPVAQPLSVVPDQADALPGVPQDMTPIRTDLDAEQILRENFTPARGTGAIRVGNGPARVIDSRTSPEFLAAQAPAGPRAPRGFTEALLNLKQVSGDNALKAAQAKAASAALAARGTAARGAAALQTSELSARLAAEHLRANPTDLAGASAILHGRAEGGGDKVFFPGLGPNDPTIVGSKRTGAVIARRPRVEAQIGKDAKGVWQILGPDGKAVRPATPDEIAQRNVGR